VLQMCAQSPALGFLGGSALRNSSATLTFLSTFGRAAEVESQMRRPRNTREIVKSCG